MSTLKDTRKAVESLKSMGGLPMLVKIVNGASHADAIQNTLTITWVFAARAALIVASVNAVEYWMVLVVSCWAAYKFCRQISNALLAMELHSDILPKWLGYGSMVVTILLSFGGLADGMFPDITNFWQLLEPKNAMKLLTITVISVAPITTIKVGTKAALHLAGSDILRSNNGELQIVTSEMAHTQQEESEAHKEKVVGKINSKGVKSFKLNKAG